MSVLEGQLSYQPRKKTIKMIKTKEEKKEKKTKNKNKKRDSKVRRDNTSKQKTIEYKIKRVGRQEKKKERKRRGRSRQCSPRTPTIDTHRSNKSIRHVYEHNLFFLFLWHLSSRFTRYSFRYSLFIAYRLYGLISLHIQHVNQFI